MDSEIWDQGKEKRSEHFHDGELLRSTSFTTRLSPNANLRTIRNRQVKQIHIHNIIHLEEEPRAIPTYYALYRMYCNTRIYVSFVQETTRFSRYKCAGVCNGGKT